MIGEGSTQSLGDRDQGVVETVAEAKSQHKLTAPPDIEFPHQGDVAIRRTVELRVHPEVVSQVLPAVGRPCVTTRAVKEWDRGPQREPSAAFVRRQHLPPGGLDHVPVVAPTANFQVRRYQREQPQLGEQFGVGIQPRVDEKARLMGIGDDLFGDTEMHLGIDIGDTITERVRGQAFMGAVQLAFIPEEGLPVSNEVLQVAYLRPINGGIIDLVHDALGNGKPDPAQSRVSGPDSVLVAACPSGSDPGTAGSRMLLQQVRHRDSFLRAPPRLRTSNTPADWAGTRPTPTHPHAGRLGRHKTCPYTSKSAHSRVVLQIARVRNIDAESVCEVYLVLLFLNEDLADVFSDGILV